MTAEEKLEKIKKLADAMYYAAANLGPTVGSGEHLRKTMEEYHKFIIHEYHKEEPVSEDLGKCTSKIILEGTNFNKSWYAHPELAFVAGANWQKQQMDEYLKDMSNEIDLIGD